MYYLLILAVGIERLVELVVSKRNAAWSFAHGGKEFGRLHYGVMVDHSYRAAGWLRRRTVGTAPPVHRLARLADARGGGAQPGAALVVYHDAGPRWNTRVIVLPDAPLVREGPYRWLHHPNYVAVVAEGFALPLVHTAWLTATAFTLANALLLSVRLRVENEALGYT